MAITRILHLEDDPLDAALIRGLLDAGGYGDEIDRVQSEAEYRRALSDNRYRLILGDYRLPGFDGMTALGIAREIRPGLPFIFVSGEMGEELAIASLKAGAADYVLKDNLGRLVSAVENALSQVEASLARTKAEEALRELARQWQSTFDAVSDAIVIVGEDHRIIRCNNAFLVLTGSGQDVVGQPYLEAMRGAEVPGGGYPLETALRHGRRTTAEMRLRDKWVEVIANPYAESNKAQGWGVVHIIRDITERKRAESLVRKQEQEFRSLAENCPDMIARYDRECRFVYVNQRMASFVGCESGQLLGKTPVEVYPSGSSFMLRTALLEVMQTSRCVECEVQFNNGRTHQIRSSPEFNENGQVIGVLAFGRDISAIKETQRALQEQAEAVASTNNALKVMLSHSRQAESAMQEKFLANIEGLIIPYLDQLDRLPLNDLAAACLRLIRENINTLVTSFTKELSAPILGLTPREIQIADLIRKGTPSKEIAELLHLSKGTVDCYRDQIREKLSVKNKKINLRSYLLSHFSE